ncbi:MAG: serine/threonine protein kinase [Candidatus Bathyarchaeota archaeon]|nr:serine/threonine protein kinase [Candidatus Bathyarchaeum sp.]
MQATKAVTLNELDKTKHHKVLCYPRCTHKELEKRLTELEKLGIQALQFTGEKSVFGVPVLGKGCVGIVVIAYTKTGKAALKIRRIDADRKEMFHEAQMLKKANTINIGPKLLETSENFLLMQLIEGKHFPEWLKTLENQETKTRLHLVLKNVLEQCYRLDKAGIDHGELNKAPKHIIIDDNDVPYLIDFETTSINRRISNVTSICQYFFLGNKIANTVKDKLGKINEKELINALRSYKQKTTKENFENIIKKILL